MAGETRFTPGPWECVPATEHHGPYVTSEFGSTIADCYAMSNPSSLSVRNGGDSKPIIFMAEMAEPNAHLIAASPKLYETVSACLKQIESIIADGVPTDWDMWRDDLRDVLAKARGEPA